MNTLNFALEFVSKQKPQIPLAENAPQTGSLSLIVSILLIICIIVGCCLYFYKTKGRPFSASIYKSKSAAVSNQALGNIFVATFAILFGLLVAGFSAITISQAFADATNPLTTPEKFSAVVDEETGSVEIESPWIQNNSAANYVIASSLITLSDEAQAISGVSECSLTISGLDTILYQGKPGSEEYKLNQAKAILPSAKEDLVITIDGLTPNMAIQLVGKTAFNFSLKSKDALCLTLSSNNPTIGLISDTMSDSIPAAIQTIYVDPNSAIYIDSFKDSEDETLQKDYSVALTDSYGNERKFLPIAAAEGSAIFAKWVNDLGAECGGSVPITENTNLKGIFSMPECSADIQNSDHGSVSFYDSLTDPRGKGGHDDPVSGNVNILGGSRYFINADKSIITFRNVWTSCYYLMAIPDAGYQVSEWKIEGNIENDVITGPVTFTPVFETAITPKTKEKIFNYGDTYTKSGGRLGTFEATQAEIGNVAENTKYKVETPSTYITVWEIKNSWDWEKHVDNYLDLYAENSKILSGDTITIQGGIEQKEKWEDGIKQGGVIIYGVNEDGSYDELYSSQSLNNIHVSYKEPDSVVKFICPKNYENIRLARCTYEHAGVKTSASKFILTNVMIER